MSGRVISQSGTRTIRISAAVHDTLVKIQQEFAEEHGGYLTLSAVIERLLAGRKPVQP